MATERTGTGTTQLQIAQQMIAQSKAAAALPLSDEEVTAGAPIARAIDAQLRILQKLMVQLANEQAKQLTAENAAPGSLLADFEIEGELNYVLSESDPAWDDESETDNILATRDAWVSNTGADNLEMLIDAAGTDGYPNSSKLIPQQCWFLHDLLDHSYGLGRPELSDRDLLRVDKVWVDVKTTRQYCLNLRTGEFKKW